MIAGFGIRWVKETVFADPAAVEEASPFLGRAELEDRTILIRADVRAADLPQIVAHEIFHVWFSLGYGLPQNQDEVEAWEFATASFGRKVLAAL